MFLCSLVTFSGQQINCFSVVMVLQSYYFLVIVKSDLDQVYIWMHGGECENIFSSFCLLSGYAKIVFDANEYILSFIHRDS